MEHIGTTIRVRIPAPYSLVATLLPIAFLGFWLILGFRSLGLTGQKEFLEGGEPSLFFWAVLWVFGTVSISYQIVWLLLGHETIEVTPDRLRYRRSLGNLGWWKEYALADVRRLRTHETGPPGTNSEIGDTPRIFFDYGAKTVKLGYGVDLAEAHQLVSEICRYYPRLSAEPQKTV